MSFSTYAQVPTGTVLLTAMTHFEVKCLPISSATEVTAETSAEPSLAEGVPTAMKINCALLTAAVTLEKNVNVLCCRHSPSNSVSPAS